MKSLTAIIAMGMMLAAHAIEPYKAKPQSVERWRDWRYGMFIHWGPVSLTGKEISWSRANSNPRCRNQGPTPVEVYDNLYKKFDPVKFDAREWVATAQAAGMRYMVFTAKHCDGFLMWDSKVDSYNIMNSPFKRDVCRELADACRAAGMGICWYFSAPDWRDPDCRNAKNAEFVKRMHAEIAELLTNYGKIDAIWFDCDNGVVPWNQQEGYAMIRRLQPDIIINERFDLGVNEGWNEGVIGKWADFHTPEQKVGAYDPRPWESCLTLSARNQWAWGGHGDGVKSFETCLKMLIGCAGGNGNTLLNIGPMPDGAIAPEQANRLKEMGDWLAKYGESIYETRGGPFKPTKFGVSTRKGNTIYLHVLKWPSGPLEFPDIAAGIVGSSVLTGGNATITRSGGRIKISLPESDRAKLNTVIALQLDKPASELEAVDVHQVSYSLAAGRKATASNVFRNDANFAADKAFDDDSNTRWGSDGGLTSGWLEVDLGAPTTVGRAIIEQGCPQLGRVKKFAIEYRAGEEWKMCYQGENLGEGIDKTFTAVTARHFRLNITGATDGPTISEFQLFAPDVKAP